MQSTCTRRLLDVEELASRQAVLTGFVEAAAMKRLLQVATMPPHAIAYRIEFARDASGRPRLSGHVEGTVRLTCQRCLDDFDWCVDSAIDVVIAGDEGEDADGQDAVVGFGGRIMLESVIEDELLLELPSAPVHPFGSCSAPPVQGVDEQQPIERVNPFSALEVLRKQGAKRA